MTTTCYIEIYGNDLLCMLGVTVGNSCLPGADPKPQLHVPEHADHRNYG